MDSKENNLEAHELKVPLNSNTTSKQKENTRKLSFSENVSKNKDINLPRDQNPRSVIH